MLVMNGDGPPVPRRAADLGPQMPVTAAILPLLTKTTAAIKRP